MPATRLRSSQASSNARPSGIPQGTPGGISGGIRPRLRKSNMKIGTEGYLWALVFMEVGAMAALRHFFRENHGG